MGYCYLLTRLAHTCYRNRKFEEAEKYFKVCLEVLPLSTKNPVNLFHGKLNLLIFYSYTDIQKAKQYCERLMVDQGDYLPGHKRDLFYLSGNIYFMIKDYPQAKYFYRECLKMLPKPRQEAEILNNLAMACWMHANQ